jgi:hypothetical protein
LAAISKAIAPAAQNGNQNSAFLQSRNLRPIRPILIAESPFPRPSLGLRLSQA